MTATETFTMEFPYRRSVGPVVGAFLTGLRDRRVLGVRTPAGVGVVLQRRADDPAGGSTTSWRWATPAPSR